MNFEKGSPEKKNWKKDYLLEKVDEAHKAQFQD